MRGQDIKDLFYTERQHSGINSAAIAAGSTTKEACDNSVKSNPNANLSTSGQVIVWDSKSGSGSGSGSVSNLPSRMIQSFDNMDEDETLARTVVSLPADGCDIHKGNKYTEKALVIQLIDLGLIPPALFNIQLFYHYSIRPEYPPILVEVIMRTNNFIESAACG